MGGDRPLIRNLNMRVSKDCIAIIGRNGVGKSSLLRVLSGLESPSSGSLSINGTTFLVPQELGTSHENIYVHQLQQWAQASSFWTEVIGQFPAERLSRLEVALRDGSLSGGEARVLHLLAAKVREPDILLLDEPSQDLDEQAVAWLVSWLGGYSGALMIVSHDPRLLKHFKHFFVIAEAGCRYLNGSFEALMDSLESENESEQRKYLRSLNVLNRQEAHYLNIKRRKQRKKALGRVRELDRCTPKVRLNARRGYAQVSQAKAAAIRNDRIQKARSFSRTGRRALQVHLPMDLVVPTLPPASRGKVINLQGVSARAGSRLLFRDLHLSLSRERLAIVGPNGAGKSTLLSIMLERQIPVEGRARAHHSQIGSIAQGAVDWMNSESLLSLLRAYPKNCHRREIECSFD